MLRLISILAIQIALFVLNPVSASATRRAYDEDFTTTVYRDPVSTALWDTSAGELRLPPYTPGIVGAYDTPSFADGVALDGKYVYVADASSGVQVIDVSDPANPVDVGGINTPGLARGVTVAGDLLFVADYGAGVRVFDCSDPANPVYLDSKQLYAFTNAIEVCGDLVFAAVHAGGLYILDASDPSNLQVIGQAPQADFAYDVVVSGEYAYVADSGFNTGGLHVFNISDPTNPAPVAFSPVEGAFGVALAGDLVYVAAWTDGLIIIDVSDPTAPVELSRFDTPGVSYNLWVEGDLAYVCDRGAGLVVVDVSDPSSPQLAATRSMPGLAHQVVVDGPYAYVSAFEGGLQVVQVAALQEPVLAGGFDTNGFSCGVEIHGKYAFVADASAGVQVYDISDPYSLANVGKVNTPGLARGLSIDGDLLYVADYTSGLRIVDISDPLTPVIIGSKQPYAFTNNVFACGDYAYLAVHAGGLYVLDVSDPQNLQVIGQVPDPEFAYDVVVRGDHAYIADSGAVTGGLHVVDISDPHNPIRVGFYAVPAVFGVEVLGDVAYLAAWSGGLIMLDVTDPAVPTYIGTYDTPGTAYHVSVHGGMAYVGDRSGGLQIVNVTNPAAPSLFAAIATPGQPHQLAVSGDFAFIGDFEAGFRAVQIFDRRHERTANVGQSFDLGAVGDVRRVRVTAASYGPVAWELSTTGGTLWQPLATGDWVVPSDVGSDLRWRATLGAPEAQQSPLVSDLFIEWLHDFAVIDSIADVGGDDGGWARLYFTRSNFDFVDEPNTPILAYNVHRRVDDPAFAAVVETDGERVEGGRAVTLSWGASAELFAAKDGRYYRLRDRYFLHAAAALWEVIGTVFARQQSQYVVAVPTLADWTPQATVFTTYFVSAHTTTPSLFFDSPPDSGYSEDNLAPAPPNALTVSYGTGAGNAVSWASSPSSDVRSYRVYRDIDPAFELDPALIVGETQGTAWTDPDYDGWNVHYKVTALDAGANESGPASTETVTGVGDGAPVAHRLYQNSPNPFNPTTTIRYDVGAGGGVVSLRIYDVAGHEVRALVEGYQAAGHKSVVWDGKSDSGQAAATGIYFYRLEAPGLVRTLKMTLIK